MNLHLEEAHAGHFNVAAECKQLLCVSCSKAFEYTRKHGFDAVRVLRLPVNRGKVKKCLICSSAC